MAGRKAKYSSENSNTKKTKIWSVAIYIRLSQEDADNGTEKTSYPNNETKQVTVPIKPGNAQYTVEESNITLAEGGEKEIVVKGDYTADSYWGSKFTCDNESFSWKSNNEKVVTVVNGKLTAIEEGKTTVEAITTGGEVITIPVTVSKILKGDVNRDGVVGLYDAFQILRTVILGDGDLSEDEQYIMDFNDDGEVGLYDAFQFLRQVILR